LLPTLLLAEPIAEPDPDDAAAALKITDENEMKSPPHSAGR
jgi:hypothetical protein